LLEVKFLKSIPFYEKLRHEVLKKLLEQLNSQGDCLIEKYYFLPEYFERENPFYEKKDKSSFEEEIAKEKLM